MWLDKIIFDFLNKFKGTESASHFESSEFTSTLEERTKRQIDDIYYNVNELQRLSNQGVDISNFKVANGIQSGKKRIGKKFSLIWTWYINTGNEKSQKHKFNI